MKKLFFAVVVLAIAFAVAGGYWWYLNRDRRLVTELVKNAAAVIEKKADDLPHAGVFKFVKIDELFDQNVTLRCHNPAIEASKSRDELKAMVSMVNKFVTSMQVSTENITVDIAGNKAVFTFDAEFSGIAGGRKEDFSNVYKINGTAVKNDGKWQISSLIAEEILQ
ncbi:MAG: nuclear transport factor 2 family protein [Lentisphaeria bacterium]|nr:nuclear transport factor 2 family protein [Lentisphaeria bacterium]